VSPSSTSCVSFCPLSLNVFPETGLSIPFYFASDFILTETLQKPNARSKLEGTRRRERKEWKEEVERDLQVQGVRRWREVVTVKKMEGYLSFDRPKPTAGCSANGGGGGGGRRRRRRK